MKSIKIVPGNNNKTRVVYKVLTQGNVTRKKMDPAQIVSLLLRHNQPVPSIFLEHIPTDYKGKLTVGNALIEKSKL